MADTATTEFENCRGVSNGGILFALPALLANGLLDKIDTYFTLGDKGNYYRLDQLFLVLAYSVLLRTKNLDQLQYRPPGEWGRLLGLDRIPEKRTMRAKVACFTENKDHVAMWCSHLAESWLEDSDNAAGVLYIDGHVRVYHGRKTKLPRRYIARQRLCLRGTTDYWVNDANGLPLFVLSSPCTDGLLWILRNDIVPQLLADIPNQPTAVELGADPLLARFCLVFDREGYSPAFFKEMWEAHRIACMTYHKYPKETWDDREFSDTKITDSCGNITTVSLAELSTLLGSKKKDQMWVREIRKRTDSGRQVSLISTDFTGTQVGLARGMYCRWTQENYFKYSRAEFSLDHLSSYQLEDMDPEKSVTNPTWRDLDYRIRSLNSMCNRRKLRKSAITIDESLSEKQASDAISAIALLEGEIESFDEEITELKAKRKGTSKTIAFQNLPEEHKFKQFSQTNHQFINAIRMLAYRSETALVNTLRDINLTKEARSIAKDIFNSDADLEVNEETQVLTVKLHQLANKRLSKAACHLANELNKTETQFPGTTLRMHYTVMGMEESVDS